MSVWVIHIRVGLDGPWGFLLAQNILWFCDLLLLALSLKVYKAHCHKGLTVSLFCFPESHILLWLTKPSLSFSEGQQNQLSWSKMCTVVSQRSLVWKGVWLINIDYNPPSASKNWLPGFLIWMPLCLDFNISVTFQWQKQGQKLNPLLKGPSYLQAPLRKTLVILLVLLYHPMGRSFVSTASNCCKLSVSTFGPCSMLHFLLREEQWYWFWIVRENARDISKELREHNT